MAIGMIAGAAAGVLGGVGQTAWQMDQARKSAHQQQDFEERMSSTAYQRGVKDMQAAGLNPMLAYSQGGASTPGVAPQAVQPAPNVASSALGAVQAMADVQQTGALTQQALATADNQASSAAATKLQILDNPDIGLKLRGEAQSIRSKGQREALEYLKELQVYTGKVLPPNPTDEDLKPNYKGQTLPSFFDMVQQDYETKQGNKRFAVAHGESEQLGLQRERAEEQFYKNNPTVGPWLRVLAPFVGGLGPLLRLLQGDGYGKGKR